MENLSNFNMNTEKIILSVYHGGQWPKYSIGFENGSFANSSYVMFEKIKAWKNTDSSIVINDLGQVSSATFVIEVTFPRAYVYLRFLSKVRSKAVVPNFNQFRPAVFISEIKPIKPYVFIDNSKPIYLADSSDMVNPDFK